MLYVFQFRQVSSIRNSCREQLKPKETSFIQDFEAKPRKARYLAIVYKLSPQVLPIYVSFEQIIKVTHISYNVRVANNHYNKYTTVATLIYLLDFKISKEYPF